MRGCQQVLRVLRAPMRSVAAPKAVRSLVFRSQVARMSTIYKGQTPFEDINRHHSDAEIRIAQVPVIEVDGDTAVCDGGGGALGHPLEYIALDIVSHEPQACKYCGLRFKKHHHH
ncbi:hypothetical protein SPRG_02655 [Saprolegnia parasitica CBS 223.65]|uniref:Zinc finger CHCC-type domain-containing protein n=1 Tax=Saprolegnia parasitica (strain CBS 223.65) TaxID=695850 RepID=A0A067CR14_SAPPC|nr:hypothetical protein SPRG_02655 [Saprolegnia parasitica CBS 223.65]KDO32963.1 hypothetical protein SPRG_02655 [Saprolegnia parasitica CBS 223.65]|eukprot:XP_012196609.1 hypothetical protein SPRG_02655 [Saprolegnia parasitica CBS 223.65]